MPRLHEIVALANGKKAEMTSAVTEAHKQAQKGDLFDGIQRTYRPLDEEKGEKLPPENKNPQADLRELVNDAAVLWANLFDLVATVDSGNSLASADIVVDGKTLAKNVTVPTLLFLKKQLTDVKTFITKLPYPDPAEQWTFDENRNMLATEPVETHRSKKVPKVIVKYPATTEHPAQTEMLQEDVLVGYWKTIKFTSRIPSSRRVAMLAQVDKLLDAVKVAREQANMTEVKRMTIGRELLSTIFGDLLKK